MGYEIIKCGRGEDLYMEWDHSDVDCPVVAAGTRVEMLEHLPVRTHDDCPTCRCNLSPERLARADVTGTSSLERGWGTGWDATGLIYRLQGFLPRAAFAAFARRWIADDEPGMAALLEPLDGEAEVRT